VGEGLGVSGKSTTKESRYFLESFETALDVQEALSSAAERRR
jgi:hypothetical protein